MDTVSDVKVIRAPSLKRGKNDERLCDRIKLKKILGLTVCSNAALDVSPSSGVLAYPAGCTVILFNSKKLSQSYLLNTSRKAVTAVAYSRCGRYIATGECGLNPAIKVWELDQINGNTENGVAGNVVAEFIGHKYAISCVAFSPTGKYLVSVGSQHDMIVNVFDWKLNLKIASNKVSAKVVGVSFSEDGNYFVTVGNRHVKFWYLEGSRKYKEPIPLMGRSAILGELRNNDFCAVACGKGGMFESTYAITRSGHLVEFNSRRLLDKWVACRTTSANCIAVSSKYILVGCAESIIRCFNAETLEYLTTLPRTHYLGVDVSEGVHINHMMSAPQNAKYPDTIAIVYDDTRAKVSCVYNDHSLYIWDLRDIRRVGKSHSFLYHSACIWGVETVPLNYIKNNLSHNLPLNCFLTCSSDDTIRVWELDGCENNDIYRKNIYSKDLLKINYIDNELNFIKDMDNPILNNEKGSSYDGRNGVRCIKISPERNHLATGDRSGNIRIYNLTNLKLITTIEAHDSEVLCLEYTNEKIDRKLLGSASRDRLIHVFDVQQGYKILQTLDDHSSSITSVKFIGSGMNFQMISCGADKSIIFRTFNCSNDIFLRGNNCAGKNTLYDMEVDSNYKHILTACQDRNIRVYSTQNAKHTKTFKGSHSDEGSLIKLTLDLSGIYIATSCTDKTLSVYDYYSNECMARMYGHSELVTGLKFTNDCKHLISASGDGCVFIWQVPHDMIITMQARLSQQALRSGHQSNQRTFSQSGTEILIEPILDNFGSPPNNYNMEDAPIKAGYKFSDVGQLPQWAKRKTNDEQSQQEGSTILGINLSQANQSSFSNNPKPRGRWAQRSQYEPELDLRNIADSPNLPNVTFNIPTLHTNNINNNAQTSDYNSSSSKDIYNNPYLSEDSSIDSGMENRRDVVFQLKQQQKNMNSLNSESNTEHDGDVEDISDGERTSSDHGMLFYPSGVPGTPTDFKVNEMNVEELRKSIRRQKLEKQGLPISINLSQSAPSTGTGTGTSDDDDEGSTPSGDNADRSLASTLGGSSESIPQQTTNSFLTAAIDGPGSSSDRERGRKSLSAIHNNDNKNVTISKSFTNNKKEELMKVINEAKQKLENGRYVVRKNDIKISNKIREVGYRSNLRTSQSISDLSHSANLEFSSRANRTQRAGDSYAHQPIVHATSNYLNCAAPKSILTKNCTIMRQIQRDYPPYPCASSMYIKNSFPLGLTPDCKSQVNRPSTLELYSDGNNQQSTDSDGNHNDKSIVKIKRHSGILKNYKSCPVSPVHEELEWSNISTQTSNIVFNEPKRHSMYIDDAKVILDMIHIDTEKMIEEITKKYGDLNEFEDTSILTGKEVKSSIQKDRTERRFEYIENEQEEEDTMFSSDSLEDCSLNLELNNVNIKLSNAKRNTDIKKKSGCIKKHKKAQKTNTDDLITSLPKRSVSDYFIYDDFSQQHRKVSLSDILDVDQDYLSKNNFLEAQRHSSASFFLGQQYSIDTRKSQESILSDDISGISYYNSMESILSDESECKSAPLEVLFNRSKKDINRFSSTFNSNNDRASKSYGSSPNATYGFDYFMQNLHTDCYKNEQDFICGNDYLEHHQSTTPTNPLPKSYISTSISYPNFSTAHERLFSCKPSIDNSENKDNDEIEFIPSLTSKNVQYNSGVSKSLSKEFAHQRQQNNSNPLFSCDGSELFVKKSLSSVNKNDYFTGGGGGCDSGVYIMKKSCSFEIEMGDSRRTERSFKKFEQNLQKFERDHQLAIHPNLPISSGGHLEMDYVPHKPPVANRRSTSMRSRSKNKVKDKFHTVSQMSCLKPSMGDEMKKDYALQNKTAKHKLPTTEEDREKSFHMYFTEKAAFNDNNIDSLELNNKFDKLTMENSIDKMDEISFKKTLNTVCDQTPEFIRLSEYKKIKDIEIKIDIINKLVEMERKKLDKERKIKEDRMKPFECDSKQKGYVRSLTMNFDNLAKLAKEEIESDKCRGVIVSNIKRNFSLPDVLEGAKFKTFEMVVHDNDSDDNNLLNDTIYHRKKTENERNSLSGIAKSLLSVHNDESSIRRACSLSDLSMGKGYKSSMSSTTYKSIPNNRTSIPSRIQPKRSASSVTKTLTALSGMGVRSVSVGILNQASDSETDIQARGGILKPTISSQNKVNGASSSTRTHTNAKNASGILNRRRGLQNAYSSVNLSTTGHDDSSSEEISTNVVNSGKPVVPPRPRSISVDHKRNNIANISYVKNKQNNLDVSSIELPCKDTDIANADLTSQLCSGIINQLMITANSVIHLHQRLKEEDFGPRNNNNFMLKELENAVVMTQNMLTKITSDKTTNEGGTMTFINNEKSNQTIGNGDYLQMMDKCSDLLNKVQKHVNNA